MCLLMVAQERFPSITLLRAAENQNDNGGGIAWTSGKQVVWKKGLTAEEMYNLRGEVTFPCLIHFRKTTAGDKSKELTHPFPVQPDVSVALEGKAKKVLAHNGTWNSWKDKLYNFMNGKTKMYDHSKGSSDTRAIAWLYFYIGDVFLEMLHQKVAVLEPGKVKTFGEGWVTKNDLMLSYDISKRTTYGEFKDTKWDDVFAGKA